MAYGSQKRRLNRIDHSKRLEDKAKNVEEFRAAHPDFYGSTARLIRVQERFVQLGTQNWKNWAERFADAWQLLKDNAEAKALYDQNPHLETLDE